MRIGYFLSSEEWGPQDLVSQAVKARDAGFQALWISDHIHPWNDTQGHSPFVWTTIGAIAQADLGLPVSTAVTCPIMRIHPAIIAHAAATASVMLDGKFNLGVGSGEALNEHVLGDPWPEAAERLEMLEEAIAVIRTLWAGGVQSHRGRYYRVQHTRIYDLPSTPPKIIVSGFGPRAVDLAAKVGDGYATVGPDAEMVTRYRDQDGTGPVQGGLKVCYGDDAAAARATVHHLWPNEALPGELAQILPTPAHFEQASELVTEELATADVPCGPDIDAHVEAIQAYAKAGFDELYVNQIGPGQDQFFAAYRDEVLPRL
ncbi:MAG TPA: TIGR03557 family F420-dependent LLM class oxidoreductase [Solirubrobacteraceae bacterium]|jgi:G6PDH family F420-dependent oxidoreductase|nr:TIGR03557 family F420-dependent LLM class oxidoreductase [Solirubrobacteraceae bacterium]